MNKIFYFCNKNAKYMSDQEQFLLTNVKTISSKQVIKIKKISLRGYLFTDLAPYSHGRQ